MNKTDLISQVASDANISKTDAAAAVEVLDAATDTPLAGFGLDDCQMPTKDGLAVPVVWNGNAALPAGRDIRLRFHLGAPGVRLYSFGFRGSSAP